MDHLYIDSDNASAAALFRSWDVTGSVACLYRAAMGHEIDNHAVIGFQHWRDRRLT